MKMAIEETTPRNDRNANFKYHDSPDYQQQLHQSQNLPSCHTQSLQYLNRWPTAGFKRFIIVKYRCLLQLVMGTIFATAISTQNPHPPCCGRR